jgi:transposase InsO family protein
MRSSAARTSQSRLVLQLRGIPDARWTQNPDAWRQTLRVCTDVIDEFTHECLSIWIARRLNSTDVIDVLSDLFMLRGVPGHVRSDNGPEFIAKAVQDWITAVGAKTAYIAPGKPMGERLCRKLQRSPSRRIPRWRDLLQLARGADRHESWRRHYNTIRPQGSIGYKPPAPEVFVPAFAAWPAALTRPASPAKLPLVQRPTLN